MCIFGYPFKYLTVWRSNIKLTQVIFGFRQDQAKVENRTLAKWRRWKLARKNKRKLEFQFRPKPRALKYQIMTRSKDNVSKQRIKNFAGGNALSTAGTDEVCQGGLLGLGHNGGCLRLQQSLRP